MNVSALTPSVTPPAGGGGGVRTAARLRVHPLQGPRRAPLRHRRPPPRGAPSPTYQPFCKGNLPASTHIVGTFRNCVGAAIFEFLNSRKFRAKTVVGHQFRLFCLPQDTRQHKPSIPPPEQSTPRSPRAGCHSPSWSSPSHPAACSLVGLHRRPARVHFDFDAKNAARGLKQ